MKKTIEFVFIFLISLISTSFVNGQNHHCGTDEYYNNRAKQHPELRIQQKKMDSCVDNLTGTHSKTSLDTGQVIIIPIVFHIIHNNGPENISDQTVTDAVARLNIDYRKKNTDTSKVRKLFRPLISDAKIEFRLAKVNPYGLASTGIDRVVSTMTYNAGENVMALNQWDTRKYLNVWVVHDIDHVPLPTASQIEGFGHFPWDAALHPETDGIVNGYLYIGKNQRVLTETIGHYFGLYHTFQDSCSINQNTQGDHVADTPPVGAANFGVNLNVNSCHTDTPDLPDMIENYMDYADIHYMFTLGQVARMRTFALGRSELVSQANINYTLGHPLGVDHSNQQIADNMVSIFPNPATNEITLSISSEIRRSGSISIFDVTGKMIFDKPNIVFEAGGRNLLFTKAGLNVSQPGVYILQVKVGNDVIRKKLVFQD